MNEVRTVSDTKRAFYTAHTRPINSIYRRVLEELIVEMHLLSVNAAFQYDALYALGVVTIFDRFMKGYRPERDIESIFNALCQSVEGDAAQYRQDAERMLKDVVTLTPDSLLAQVSTASPEGDGLLPQLRRIADNPDYKYSRLFAVGLYRLLETIDPKMATDNDSLEKWLESATETLNLAPGKLQKDLELYRSNLEKFAQAQAVMEDILQVERKKKEERARKKEEELAQASSASAPEESTEEASSSGGVSDS